MKRISLFLFFIFSIIFLHTTHAAPNINIDSIKAIINTQSQEAKVNSINDLAHVLYSVGEYEQAEQASQNAIQYAQKLGYKIGEADALNNIGLIMLTKNDYTNAVKQFVAALKIKDEAKDYKGIALIKTNIGKVFLAQGDVESALGNLNTALSLYESVNNKNGIAEVSKSLGDVYIYRKIYGKAREHYKRAMDLYIEQGQAAQASSIASRLGKIVVEIGDYDGALVYFKTSLDLNTAAENMPNVANDFTNIARTYLAQQDTQNATQSIQTALEIREQLRDNIGIAECKQVAGAIFANSGNKKQADLLFQESIDLLNRITPNANTLTILKDISSTYAEMGDHKKAYEYANLFSKTKEQVFNQEKSKALLELTTRYESEFAVKEQRSKIEKLELEKTSNYRKFYFLLAIIVLGAISLFALYNNYKIKKDDNKLLTNKNAEIQYQKNEINIKNTELNEKNARLDDLNTKLINEIAERESIEQFSFARDSFLATVSTQMRSPINVIVGMGHILMDEKLKKEHKDYVQTMLFASNNLTVFINDMLDFSKIEAGKLSLDKREFHPRKVFEEIRERFKPLIYKKNLNFNLNIDPAMPELLMGDSSRLAQVLSNLLNNALQFTNEGRIDINVRVDNVESDTFSTLFLTISDTGVGISPQKLHDMFHKFSYLNDDLFDGFDSSGLGLAITKRLVELQNGRIEARSIEGEGTIIMITLPFEKIKNNNKSDNDNDKNAKLAVKRLNNAFDPLKNNKILIVEDNKINQLVVVKMLKKAGAIVATADNGEEALEKLNNDYYDLILMDIQMPIMDGYRATAEIRKLADTKKQNVPIIALTASAFLTEREKAQLFGMNDHISKPFSPEELLEKVTNLLTTQKV